MRIRRGGLGSLGWRLLAAFVAVAVGAVALLALVAAVSVDRGTSRLLSQQRAQLRTQIASALAASYSSGRGSWGPADLAGVQSLASAGGTQVDVLDRSGHYVTTIWPDHDQYDGWGQGSWQPGGSGRPTATPPPATHGPGHTTRGGEPAHPSTGSGWSDWHDRGDAQGADDPQQLALVRRTGTTGPIAPAAADVVATAVDSTAAGTATVPSRTSGPGPVLTASPAGTGGPGGTGVEVVPIVVNGQQVGMARMTLPVAADAVVAEARAALLRNVAAGAVLAGLLAAAAAVMVSRRLSRPLLALAGAARALAAGDPAAETLVRPAPGELGEVGRAFTLMARALRREDDLRRAVVADVAHELRTPVTILRGQTEQLLDGIADPTPQRLVSLHDEVLRLERLTEDLATLSAADAAGLSLRTGPVDLGDLTRNTVAAMAAGLDEADLTVVCELEAGTIVSGDTTRLTQVITNLLSNAAKFTPPGGLVTVAVHARGPHAALTVTDTGPGIPTDELPHVFDRFWRGRAAGSRSGSGIGLAVVHALVTAHGGTVTVQAPAEGGTRVTVLLPQAPPQGRRHEPDSGPPTLAHPTPQAMT